MKKSLKTALFLILFFGIYACKKNQLGGKAELKGVVMHHSKPIPNAYIYIKYDAIEFPGADYSLYDTYIQADANGNYSFSLYKGSYYVYSYGLDYDIPPPYSVKGGLSISIRNREVLTKNIAVTE